MRKDRPRGATSFAGLRTTWFKVFCGACLVLLANSAIPVAAGQAGPYDETADGEKQIADAVVVAGQQHKHVLLQFGSNSCVPCRQLHTLFEEDKAVHLALGSNFVYVLIDVLASQNNHLLDTYRARINYGIPILIVLDGNGKYLAINSTGDMGQGAGFDSDKVLAFLHLWAPKSRSELAAQIVAVFLDEEFNLPVDGNLPQFQPVREFETDTVPLLLGVLTNRTETGASISNVQERRRACAALGLVDADLWTNQPPAEKPRLAKELVGAFTEGKAQGFSEDLPEFLAVRRIGSDTVPCFMDVIREPSHDSSSRIQAYWALGGLHTSPEIVVPFLAGQFNTNQGLLDFAGEAIVAYGPESRRAIPALTNAFHSADFMLSSRAAMYLAKLYPKDAELVPTLTIWLQSTDVVHRRFGAGVLAELGAAAQPAATAIAHATRDPDETVRRHAREALAQIDVPDAAHVQ